MDINNSLLRLGMFLNGLHKKMSCRIFVASLQFVSKLGDSKHSPPLRANFYVSEFDYSPICYEIRNKKDNHFRIASSVNEERNLPTW
jgi:hypothetical protein